VSVSEGVAEATLGGHDVYMVSAGFATGQEKDKRLIL